MLDRFGISLKMFSIVELTELGRQKLYIMPLFGKFFASKLEVPKIPFGIVTLKHYRTVNTRLKVIFSRSF